jgi:hypothetical protein
MKYPALAFGLVSALSACTATSSSGAFVPGQVDADDPNGPNEASASAVPPSTAPGPSGGADLPGCPSARPIEEEPTTEITSADDLRARVAGVYRSCLGGNTGLELRVDPDTDRLLFYSLDERFVRLTDAGTYGWIEVGDCAQSSCTIESNSDIASMQFSGKIVVWSNPFALEIIDTERSSGTQWRRVAD